MSEFFAALHEKLKKLWGAIKRWFKSLFKKGD